MNILSKFRRRTKSNTGDSHRYVTIILNSIKPYCYELNNLLALPEGFEYRVRFQKSWIPTIADPTRVQGHSGLVVLRDFSNGKFFPLRRIAISKVLRVGEIFHIRFQLRSLVELSSSEEERQRQLQQFNDLMASAIGRYDNPANDDLKNLIFFGPDLSKDLHDDHFTGEESDRDYNEWGNVVRVIGDLPIYQDVDFLKVITIEDQAGKPVKVTTSDEGSSYYELSSGATYTLQVLQRTFTHRGGDSSVLSTRRIRLQAEQEDVRLIQMEYPIAGKYDIYTFPFKVIAGAWSKYSFLLLLVVRADATLVLPAIQLPVLIQQTRVRVWGTAFGGLVFLAALATFFFAQQVLGVLGLASSAGDVDTLQKLSLMVMVLTSGSLPGIGAAVTSLFKISLPGTR